MYDSNTEMLNVTGKLSENNFINHQKEGLKKYHMEVKRVIRIFKL